MRVCDVVLNSIWYDPRVRKQILAYLDRGVELSCVGMKCARYDEEKIKMIPCKTNVVQINPMYDGQQKSFFRKVKRELLRLCAVRDAIIYEQPDIIHANDLNALIPAYLAKRKLGCKLVYDSHEVYIENYTVNGRSSVAAIMKLVERYLIKHAEIMVCVSNAAASYFANTYHIAKPLVVTNCSLKKEMVDVDTNSKHLGFEVLNHGQLYEGRGYDIMVKACSLLTEFEEIKLAVRGFGRMERMLREMAEELPNKEQFLFYPAVTVEELIPSAGLSHVGVAVTEPICLNFKLSVSNKLFEYASAGLPVIMSDIPEHRFLNDKYHIGIILEDNTPEIFAKAVRKLYEDADFYQQCALNAKLMSEEVNWENEFEKLIFEEEKIVS